MAARKLTPRVKRFLLLLEGEALLDPVSAARLAGYSRPVQSGHHLAKVWADRIAEIEVRVKSKVVLKGEQILQRLSTIANDTAHPQQVKALELLARIQGMLSEKFDIRVSRTDMLETLSISVDRLRRSQE